MSYAPELRTVTPDGDLLGAYAAAGGSAKAPSFIEVQAAVEEARQQPGRRWRARVVELRAELEAVRAEQAAAQARPSPWPPRPARRPRAQRNAAGRRLAELGAAARSAKAEADGIAQSRFQAEQARDRDLAGLTDLEERLRNAAVDPDRHRSVHCGA